MLFVSYKDCLIFHQDNKSTILILENGKQSSTKRTRALNVCCFWSTDQIEKRNIEIQCWPKDKMAAN